MPDSVKNTSFISQDDGTKRSTAFYVVVCLTFVSSGAMSTIASKWSDTVSAPGPDGKDKLFDHPFFQTWLMFIGEFTCMVYFLFTVWRKKRNCEELVEGVDYTKPMNKFLFAIPAACDFTATTTMYFGLTMTQASVYQMLRGATVVFTGLFSRFALGRSFKVYQWFGMCCVTGGLALVGLSSTLFASSSTEASNPILGDILVICAQLIVSLQMVIEEKILTKYNVPPFLLVGWEGVFGLGYCTTALFLFQAFGGQPDNAVFALYQIGNSWQIATSCFLALLSFPLLNGTGQIITKNISATARMVLDTVRNVVVWVFTLAYASYFKEEFQWLQLVGFLMLITGNAIYRHFIKIPCGICGNEVTDEEEETLINHTQDDTRASMKSHTSVGVHGDGQDDVYTPVARGH